MSIEHILVVAQYWLEVNLNWCFHCKQNIPLRMCFLIYESVHDVPIWLWVILLTRERGTSILLKYQPKSCVLGLYCSVLSQQTGHTPAVLYCIHKDTF